jgi:hypothetical protein
MRPKVPWRVFAGVAGGAAAAVVVAFFVVFVLPDPERERSDGYRIALLLGLGAAAGVPALGARRTSIQSPNGAAVVAFAVAVTIWNLWWFIRPGLID